MSSLELCLHWHATKSWQEMLWRPGRKLCEFWASCFNQRATAPDGLNQQCNVSLAEMAWDFHLCCRDARFLWARLLNSAAKSSLLFKCRWQVNRRLHSREAPLIDFSYFPSPPAQSRLTFTSVSSSSQAHRARQHPHSRWVHRAPISVGEIVSGW